MNTTIMDEVTANWLMGFAGRLVHNFCILDTVVSEDDLIMEAVAAGVKMFPQWDPSSGPLANFLSARMYGAIQDVFRKRFGRGDRFTSTVRAKEAKAFHFGSSTRTVREGLDCFDGGWLPAPSEADMEGFEAEDYLAWIREFYNITSKSYQVLLLYYGYGYTLRQIGKELNMCPSLVSRRMKYLRTLPVFANLKSVGKRRKR